MKWRITLRCGCVYSAERAPDLSRPFICSVENADINGVYGSHGLVTVMAAERIEGDS